MANAQRIYESEDQCGVDCMPIGVGKNYTVWVKNVNNPEASGQINPKQILLKIKTIFNDKPSKQKYESIAKELGTPLVHMFLQYHYPLGIEQTKSVDSLLKEYQNLDWSNQVSIKRFTSNYKSLDDDVVRLHFLSRSTGGGEPMIAGGKIQDTQPPMNEMPLLWARDLIILGLPSRTIGNFTAIEEGVRAYSATGDPLYVNPRSHEFVTEVGVAVEVASIAAAGSSTRFGVGVKSKTALMKPPLKQTQIHEILSIPKHRRPAPETYLTQKYIQHYLAKFDGGAVRIISKKRLDKYGTAGPNPSFIMPKSYVDKVIKDSDGDIKKIAGALGLRESTLDPDDLLLVEIPPSKDIKIPSGNEIGANENWLPGGLTSGGIPEAVMKLPPVDKLKIKPLFGE